MTSVTDVAEQILRSTGRIDTFRLQKLTFYAQAVHLASTGQPLFHDRIEAWANGPCAPVLYQAHRGSYTVDTVGGVPDHLNAEQRASIERALQFYGAQSSQWLINQTHQEDPWRDARKGLAPGQRGHQEITTDQIRAYYSALYDDPEVEAALVEAATAEGLTSDEIRRRYLHA